MAKVDYQKEATLSSSSSRNSGFDITFDEAIINNQKRITEAAVDSFSYISSIFQLYTAAKIVIKDFAKESINKIKTGLGVTVSIYDSKGYIHTSRMAVFSFTKVPGPQVGDYIEIILISEMYFKDTVYTKSHKGTVSEIISKILDDSSLKEYKNSSKISATDDLSRIRYQTGERTQDFALRILKYGIIDNKPVYLYNNVDGELVLKGVSEMTSETPKYLFTPSLSDQLKMKSDLKGTTIEVNMFAYQFISSGKTAVSTILSKFSTELFKSPNTVSTYIKSHSVENDNAQSKVLTPPRTDFYGWNLTPNDALSISSRKNFEETVDTYTLSTTLKGFSIRESILGNAVYVLLPYDPTASSSTGVKVNCGEGKYLIDTVKFIFENGQATTVVKLDQVEY